MIGLYGVLPKVASFDESSYILLLDDVKQQASLTHNKLQFDISQRSCTIIEYDEKNNNPPPYYIWIFLFRIRWRFAPDIEK